MRARSWLSLRRNEHALSTLTPEMHRAEALLLAHRIGGGSVTVRVASGFIDRARGLLGTAALGRDAGLLLQPCSSVHTMAMAYPIDVVFIDANAKVLRVVTLRPWRAARCWRAAAVVELAAGVAGEAGINAGTVLHEVQPWLQRTPWWALLRTAAQPTKAQAQAQPQPTTTRAAQAEP